MLRSLLILSALPAAAFAQTNREVLPSGPARVLIQKYAECVVGYRTDAVRAGVEAVATSGDPKFPVLDQCVRGAAYSAVELRFPPEVYTYAMADALYAADYSRAPVVSYETVPRVAPPEVPGPRNMADAKGRRASEISAAYDRAVAQRYLLIVGDCVVRTAPQEIHELLASPVETRDEATALLAVQPVVARCLPKGQTARFTKLSLRGVLAINAHLLSKSVRRATNAEVKKGA